MAWILSVPVLLALACSLVDGKAFISAVKSSDDWDHLVFAQSWPQSLCEHENETTDHECIIPSKLKTWSVHGLWPSKGTRHSPSYCDDSYHFNMDEIKGLEPELDIQWANMFADTAKDSFWDHEWTKHGTCALNLPSISGEKKFFAKGLELNQKYNILQALEKGGIEPSSQQTYQASDISDALNSAFSVRTCFSCSSADDDRQVLGQVEICMDKELSLIDCPTCDEECRDSDPVYYHPLHYN